MIIFLCIFFVTGVVFGLQTWFADGECLNVLSDIKEDIKTGRWRDISLGWILFIIIFLPAIVPLSLGLWVGGSVGKFLSIRCRAFLSYKPFKKK